jgi:hypothetical protein
MLEGINMKKFGMGLTIVAVALAIAMVLSMMPNAVATGNGAPSGAHYNLNIIGVPKAKQAVDTTNNGNRIFVNLYGQGTKIWLTPGDDFKVLDYDGTDGSAALQMLDPYPGTTTTATYKIYVRVLGKPGGSMNLTSGFVDEYGNYWYSLESVILTREKGQSKFSDKTLQLTTVYVDKNGDGTAERYYLFDNALWDYFWNYDNNGCKLLQMRIYVQ